MRESCGTRPSNADEAVGETRVSVPNDFISGQGSMEARSHGIVQVSLALNQDVLELKLWADT
jgi:hypothetical protein